MNKTIYLYSNNVFLAQALFTLFENEFDIYYFSKIEKLEQKLMTKIPFLIILDTVSWDKSWISLLENNKYTRIHTIAFEDRDNNFFLGSDFQFLEIIKKPFEIQQILNSIEDALTLFLRSLKKVD